MEVKILDRIDEIEVGWERLLQGSNTGTVWQSYMWVVCWQKHAAIQGLNLETKILGVYDKSMLAGVGVFVGQNIQKIKTIKFLGMDELYGYKLSDYGDIVAERGREEKVWREVLRYISAQRLASSVQLDYVREESPSFKVLPKVAAWWGWKIKIEKQWVAPFIDLPQSWEEYLFSLGRKKRHELKRKLRLVEEGLEPALKIIDRGVSKQIREEFIKLVKLSSEAKAVFMRQGMADFFGDLMKESMREHLGKLFWLEAKNKGIAAVFGFEFKNGWYLYNGGFDRRIKYPVGVTLFGLIIKVAIEKGIKRVDFLRGDERYKYDLGAKDQQLWRMTLIIDNQE